MLIATEMVYLWLKSESVFIILFFDYTGKQDNGNHIWYSHKSVESIGNFPNKIEVEYTTNESNKGIGDSI